MDSDSITVSTRDLQAYETAMLTFLGAASTIAAQLTKEGHAFAAPLRAEVDKAVFAHGSWYAAKWIASGKTQERREKGDEEKKGTGTFTIDFSPPIPE